jgi:hypothetical protein
MDAALPSVHGACTTRCSARCPLSAGGEEVAAVSISDTVDVVETADTLEIQETRIVAEFASA